MGILGKIFKNNDEEEVVSKTAEVKADSKKAEKNEEKAVEPKKVEKVKEKEILKSKKNLKRLDINAYRVISYPLITEKATDLTAMHKYVFVVPQKVNKSEIKKTIANIYGVKPLKVNSINKDGKETGRGKVKGMTKGFKKVIVTMPADAEIEVYEGV